MPPDFSLYTDKADNNKLYCKYGDKWWTKEEKDCPEVVVHYLSEYEIFWILPKL